MIRILLILVALAAVGLVAYLILGRTPAPPAPTVASTTVPNPLRIATEGAYPPFNATDAAGALIGFEVDLAADLCRRIQVECQVVAQNFDGIIPGLQAGKYDAIMAGLSITGERKEAVDFTAAYARSPVQFLAPKTGPLASLEMGVPAINLENLDPPGKAALEALRKALQGKTVGVQAATIHAAFMDQYMPDVGLRRYDTLQTMTLDLLAGRTDAAMSDLVVLDPVLDSPDGQSLTLVGPAIEGGVFGQGIGAAIRKDQPALLDALNRAIAEAKSDGSLRQLADKWFGFDAAAP